jgi:hypothetical protein
VLIDTDRSGVSIACYCYHVKTDSIRITDTVDDKKVSEDEKTPYNSEWVGCIGRKIARGYRIIWNLRNIGMRSTIYLRVTAGVDL